MLLWYGLLGVAAANEWEYRGGNSPNNADLAALRTNLKNYATNEFFKPNSRRVDKQLRKIIKKWDTKILKRIGKKGCLIESPSFTVGGAATCAQQAIDLIETDFYMFIDAYIDGSASLNCMGIYEGQQRKVKKLAKALQRAAKESTVTTNCPHGFCKLGRCAFDLADGGFASSGNVVALENEMYPDVIEFSGIKYADSERLRSPVMITDYSDTDFSQPGFSCATVSAVETGSETLPVSTDTIEDCLYIRIWMKKAALMNGETKKVMSWIHGGTFNFGGADATYENPATLVDEQDIIIAKLNYRLGPFGNWYFPLQIGGQPKGGLSIQDQRMGLAWIKNNIAKFHGDAADITLGGASSGGTSVLVHMTSPASHDLFKNALTIGAPQIEPWTEAEATMAYGYITTDVVQCTTADDFVTDALSGDLLTCLQAIPLAEFQAAMLLGGAIFQFIASESGRLSQLEQIFALNIDGDTVTTNPRVAIKAKSADVKSDLGFYLHEISTNEGTTIIENLFASESFKESIYGDNYPTLFQEFNAHITVPKPAHDGIMAALYIAAGEEFVGQLLGEDALGCPNPVENDPYGGLLTECKDHTADWISSWVWFCNTRDFMLPLVGDALIPNMYITQMSAGKPGPDHGQSGVMQPDVSAFQDCYEAGQGKSCHVAGQTYLFGAAVNQGLAVTEDEAAFGVLYRAAHADLIKNGVAQTSGFSTWTESAGEFNDMDIGNFLTGTSNPYPNVCPLFDGIASYGSI